MKSPHSFKNRVEAGRLLAGKLLHLKLERPVVVALPRGGVPVGYEVAKALNCPLEVCVVRKIGAPGAPELGIGAMAEDGSYWINSAFASALDIQGQDLQEITNREAEEVKRRVAVYRGGKTLPPLKDRTVILVDDGVAMGVTATVAARYLKSLGAKKIMVAVPVCAPDAADTLGDEVDEVLCLRQPIAFYGVGMWYEDFSQLSDAEVIQILDSAQTKAA